MILKQLLCCSIAITKVLYNGKKDSSAVTSSQTSNFDGAIAAANSLIAAQGYGIKDYPSNMGGLISAINSLNLPPSVVGITPPQWLPTRDENGNITGDGWEPAPQNGTLWFDTRQGRLMVWINDGFYQANGSNEFIAVGETAPTNPVKGEQWYNDSNGIYYIFDGSVWVALTGGDNSFNALSTEIDLLRNQLDQVSLRRSAGREYQIFDLSQIPTNVPSGKVSANTNIPSQITTIAVSDEDQNSIISQPGAIGDLIDIEASDGSILRFSITEKNENIYTVTKVLGNRTLVADELVKVFIYPQNQEYATLEYTDAQIASFQAQIDAMTISVTANQMSDLEAEIDSLTAVVNALPTGATPEQLAALQTQIDTNLVSITSSLSSITNLDTRLSTAETTLINTATATDLTNLTNTVTNNKTDNDNADIALGIRIDNINAPQMASDISSLQSELDGLIKIHYSATVPVDNLSNGDFWFDTEELRILVRHQGVWLNPDRNADFDSTSNEIKEAISEATDFSDLQTRIAQL
jgi:hypothetical protein